MYEFDLQEVRFDGGHKDDVNVYISKSGEHHRMYFYQKKARPRKSLQEVLEVVDRDTPLLTSSDRALFFHEMATRHLRLCAHTLRSHFDNR